jgi:TRAP-type C4-dicarboxylate transport system permease small subunit
MNRVRPTTCVKLALLAISIILMAAAVFIGGGIIVAAYLLIMVQEYEKEP